MKIFTKLSLITILLCLTTLTAINYAQETIRVMSYNVLNYPNFWSDSILVADTTGRNPYFRTIFSSINPDIAVLQEVEGRADAEAFLANVMNGYGETYELGWRGTSGDDNPIYFKADKFDFISSYFIIDQGGSGSHPTIEYRLLHEATGDTLIILNVHLTYGPKAERIAKRKVEADAIRQRTSTYSSTAYCIALGDFNIYGGTEAAFDTLLDRTHDGWFDDPLGLEVYSNWSTSGLTEYNTHNTRDGSGPYLGGGGGFGLDERFDLILNSKNVLEPGGFMYKAGSYVTYGNDGLHNNRDVNEQPNNSVPVDVADALYMASDHLPVCADYYVGVEVAEAPAPGDIVFTQVGADNADVVEFVTLKEMNLTKLKITNSGVDLNGDLTGGDGTFDLLNTPWVNIPAGTFVRLGIDLTNDNDHSDRIIQYDATGSSPPTLYTGSTGDQLIAYTGTEADPTYIASIIWGNDGWLSGPSTSFAPNTPSDIELGDLDNYYFNGSVDGNANETRTAVMKISDWVGSGSRVGYQDLTDNIGNTYIDIPDTDSTTPPGPPAPGDIVFTQVGADNPDVVEFITLKALDLTTLKITNSGVDINGDLTGGDGTFDLTNTPWTNIPSGTFVRLANDTVIDDDHSDRIIRYGGAGDSPPTLYTGSTGDQLIAYTGTTEDPTYIASIIWGNDGWQSGPSTSFAPGTPSDIELGTLDNYYFNGSVDGDANATRTAVMNTSAWAGSNSNIGFVDLTSNVGNSAMPVELTFFSGTLNGRNVELRWRTETEVNNYGFEIECAAENMDWKKIGFVEGQGNSSSSKNYTYIDLVNVSSGNLYYRLKQVDNDGSFEYSDVVSVQVSIPSEYRLSQNYPNPFNPETRIEFTLPEKQLVSVKVYNLLGEYAAEIVNEVKEAGKYSVVFNASGLPSGMYVYTLETSGYTANRKMILLK
jgi:endonuclease/exonuclease/phosphatase family metal-dependent hydrolase